MPQQTIRSLLVGICLKLPSTVEVSALGKESKRHSKQERMLSDRKRHKMVLIFVKYPNIGQKECLPQKSWAKKNSCVSRSPYLAENRDRLRLIT